MGRLTAPQMSTVVVNGSDPQIYLTNGARELLGLTGENTRAQSIVQAAQDGYFTATGEWPYVAGMPNTPGTPPEPPVPTATIGDVSVTGPGLSGDSAAWTTGDEHELTAAISGDASDTVYVWSVRSGDAIGFVGVNAGKTVHVSCEKAGAATLRCLATATASDSPQEKTLSIVVTDPAKQTKNTSKK